MLGACSSCVCVNPSALRFLRSRFLHSKLSFGSFGFRSFFFFRFRIPFAKFTPFLRYLLC